MPSASGPRHPYQPEPPLERWRSPWSLDDEAPSPPRSQTLEAEERERITSRTRTVPVPRVSPTILHKASQAPEPAAAEPEATIQASPPPVEQTPSTDPPPAEPSRSPFISEKADLGSLDVPARAEPAGVAPVRPSGSPVPTLPVREITVPIQPTATNEYRPGYSPPLSGRVPTRMEPRVAKPTPKPSPKPAQPAKKQADDFEDIRRAVRGPNLAPMRGIVPLAVGVLLFMVLAWAYLMDGRLPDDEDLLTVPAMAPAQTPAPRAAALLTELLQNLPALKENTLNVWRWETPALGRVSGQYLRSFDTLQQLLLETEWQHQHPCWRDAQLGSLSPAWTTLLDASAIRAAYHLRRAEEDEALVAALELTQLSAQLAPIGSSPGYILQSLNLQDQAASILAEVLRSSSRLDAAALGTAQSKYAQHEVSSQAMRPLLNQLYLYERRFLVGPLPHEPLDSLTASMLQIRPGRLFFKPHSTLRFFTDSFRELKLNVTAPAYQQRQAAYQPLGPAGVPNTAWGAPNCKGIGYANERLWSYAELVNHFYRVQAKHRLILLFIALKRATVDRGSAPAALTDLAPQYLSSIPADPYSPQPFSYDLGKGVLYSAGTDFSPTGGNKDKAPLSDPTEPTLSLR